MKRFLSMLLATLMLLACLPALAEPTSYREFGFSLDFSPIQEKSAHYPFLSNYGVVLNDPFVSLLLVSYIDLPSETVYAIQEMIKSAESDEELNQLSDTLTSYYGGIAMILVTNAKSLAEAGIEEPLPEGSEATEFGTVGDYHYYYITQPVNTLLSFYDEADDTIEYEISPQEMKAADLADIRMVQSEVLKQLQAAELSEPVNTGEDFIGKTIRFESVDLDGNPVSSADLFKDNRVTMVNLWGTWCVNCMNEMGKLAEIHKRIQEKGCGIVGVEYERDPIETVRDTARQVFADNGITYPNVIIPANNPIFNEVSGYPWTFFVDSEGRILTYPIKGAAVNEYEPTIEKLLAGENAEATTDADAAASEGGEYRFIVCDSAGNPVKGVIVQLCDDTTCAFQKTRADGVATFQVETPKAYDVHIAKVPDGYVSSDETFKTPDTFSEMNIFISKAE